MVDMDEKLIKAKIALDRGKYWMSYVNFLMLVFIAASSIKEYPQLTFLQSRYWLIILLISSFAAIAILGVLDLKFFGTYQKEAEIMARINPYQKRILENQEKILARLDALEKNQKNQKNSEHD